jgi:hypothetical protein
MLKLTVVSVDTNDVHDELVNELEKIKALSCIRGNANLSCLSENTTFYFASVFEELTARSIEIAERLVGKVVH